MKRNVIRCLVVLLGIVMIPAIASAEMKGNKGNVVAVQQQEMTFNSMDEAIEWLTNYAKDHPEYAGEILNAIQNLSTKDDLVGDSCKNTTLTPSSISITESFTIKFYQIVISVYLNNCGSIICSDMGFDLYWSPGPSEGAILIGPFPSEPPQQVCVGTTIVSKGYMILSNSVPNGSYNIQVKVGGFGYALYLNIPVSISR